MSEQGLESSTEVLFARVEPELKRQLVDRAREHDRSLSGEMRVLLRGALRAERQGRSSETERWMGDAASSPDTTSGAA